MTKKERAQWAEKQRSYEWQITRLTSTRNEDKAKAEAELHRAQCEIARLHGELAGYHHIAAVLERIFSKSEKRGPEAPATYPFVP